MKWATQTLGSSLWSWWKKAVGLLWLPLWTWCCDGRYSRSWKTEEQPYSASPTLQDRSSHPNFTRGNENSERMIMWSQVTELVYKELRVQSVSPQRGRPVSLCPPSPQKLKSSYLMLWLFFSYCGLIPCLSPTTGKKPQETDCQGHWFWSFCSKRKVLCTQLHILAKLKDWVVMPSSIPRTPLNCLFLWLSMHQALDSFWWPQEYVWGVIFASCCLCCFWGLMWGGCLKIVGSASLLLTSWVPWATNLAFLNFCFKTFQIGIN